MENQLASPVQPAFEQPPLDSRRAKRMASPNAIASDAGKRRRDSEAAAQPHAHTTADKSQNLGHAQPCADKASAPSSSPLILELLRPGMPSRATPDRGSPPSPLAGMLARIATPSEADDRTDLGPIDTTRAVPCAAPVDDGPQPLASALWAESNAARKQREAAPPPPAHAPPHEALSEAWQQHAQQLRKEDAAQRSAAAQLAANRERDLRIHQAASRSLAALPPNASAPQQPRRRSNGFVPFDQWAVAHGSEAQKRRAAEQRAGGKPLLTFGPDADVPPGYIPNVHNKRGDANELARRLVEARLLRKARRGPSDQPISHSDHSPGRRLVGRVGPIQGQRR